MTDSTPKQEPPYGLRMPPDLKDRVKEAAKANNRSMNAEIVATLEEKYPKPTIDLRAVVDFLESLPPGFTDEEGYTDRVAYLKALNLLLSTLPHPYTISEELGAITFYPYPSRLDDLAATEEEKMRIAEALEEHFIPNLSDEVRQELIEHIGVEGEKP